MDYVNFGRTGLKVSRLCLGCMSYGTSKWRSWVLDEDAARPFFRRALEAGINFFDTADMYANGASEEVTGRALKQLAKRDEIVIATKVGNPVGPGLYDRGLSRKRIMAGIDASLKRLGTDYVDLYQIHRYDPATPIEETIEALHDVVKAGKVRYLGASSMFAWQFAQALAKADARGLTRFAGMQNHYNLVYREEEREMIPLCRAEGVALIPWSPLARGFLAGNRSKADRGATERAKTDEFAHRMYYQDADFTVAERVQAVAAKRGARPAQVALAWLLAKPWVTAPIIGATRLEQLNELIAAIDLKLADDEIKTLEEPYRPHPVLGHM